ncbi:UDP-glucuronic acid decarboxylase family protein [Acidisoma cladoniae]|uniref:UDP-glucuronic acid decarboxylase family protein n=1 Tax=Acidisoma cladoniae TaxID=3040935 RepID=UPI00254C59B9|nr:UDP-glucuronic acid decarboxylase family protein [Acidisoma sp. PAMC 29798]
MKTRSFRTALVAGGAGFVGSHLCDHLIAAGYRVTCLDSLLTSTMDNLRGLLRDSRFSFVEHDVINPLPRGLTADLVFNLACAASPPLYQLDPVHTMMTSVVGTNNLLIFAAEQGARLFQASTSEVYGNPTVHPQPESYFGNVNTVSPRACYDEGKRAAETLCFDYLRQGMADVRVARIFNTYGPRLRASDGRVVSNMVSQAIAGEAITVYGDGAQTRSFCYVDDLIDGVMRLMLHEAPLMHPVNLGNPTELPIVEIAAMIRTLAGSSSPFVFRPLPVDDPCRRQPDITLARALLQWQPRIGLTQGLERTIDWFREVQEQTVVGGAAERTV